MPLLKYKSDHWSGYVEGEDERGKDFVGLHHLGFWVDDVEETESKIEKAGGKYLMGRPEEKAPNTFYEIKYRDPNGVIVTSTEDSLIGRDLSANPDYQQGIKTAHLGELGRDESARAWLERGGPRIVNMYGITETTVHVTCRPLTPEDLRRSHESRVVSRETDQPASPSRPRLLWRRR